MTCKYDPPDKWQCNLCADKKKCRVKKKQKPQPADPPPVFNRFALIEERKKKSITVQGLSRIAKITVKRLHEYEAGTATPWNRTIIELAEALRISPDKLYKEDER